MNTHVVLLQSENNTMSVIGENGQPMSLAAAEKLAKKYRESTFNLRAAFAAPIQGLSVENTPLPRGK
jgi:hypothetical protein